VHEIAGRLAELHHQIGLDRPVVGRGGEAGVGRRALAVGVERRRQLVVGLAASIDLERRSAGLGESVGAGELTVKLIEAAVLEIENDDVADAVESRLRRVLSCRRRADRQQRGHGGDRSSFAHIHSSPVVRAEHRRPR